MVESIKGKKEEKHWNAPQCQGGPAGPAAHGQARRAGGLKEEHGKRRNAKQGCRVRQAEAVLFHDNLAHCSKGHLQK